MRLRLRPLELDALATWSSFPWLYLFQTCASLNASELDIDSARERKCQGHTLWGQEWRCPVPLFLPSETIMGQMTEAFLIKSA